MKRKTASVSEQTIERILRNKDKLITPEWINGLVDLFESPSDFARLVCRSTKTVWSWRKGERRPDTLAVRRMLEIAAEMGYNLPGSTQRDRR